MLGVQKTVDCSAGDLQSQVWQGTAPPRPLGLWRDLPPPGSEKGRVIELSLNNSPVGFTRLRAIISSFAVCRII